MGPGGLRGLRKAGVVPDHDSELRQMMLDNAAQFAEQAARLARQAEACRQLAEALGRLPPGQRYVQTVQDSAARVRRMADLAALNVQRLRQVAEDG